MGGDSWGVTAGYGGASMGTTGQIGYNVGDTAHAYPVFLREGDITQGYRPNHAHQRSAYARADWEQNGTHLWFNLGQSAKTLGATQGITKRWYDVQTLSAGWQERWSDTLSTTVRLSSVTHELHFNMHDSDAVAYAQARALMQLSPVNLLGDYRLGDAETQQVELQVNWDPNPDLHFVLGADTRRVEAQQSQFLGLLQEARETASGGFAAMDWTWIPNWTLSLGLRAENETLGGSRLSPRASLVWTIDPTRSFRVGYFTSTRSPQLMEQRVDYSFPYTNDLDPNAQLPLYLVMSRISPNPNLGPEKTVNLEWGYRQSIGPVTLDLTAYWMKIRNQISQVHTATLTQTILIPTGGIPPFIPEQVPIYVNQFQNRGDATNKGLELALTWAIQNEWSAGFNGRYLNYEQDDPANGPAILKGTFSYAPKHLLTLWTRFASGPWSAYLDVQHVGSTYAEALTATSITYYEKRPAYVQLDAQVQREFVRGLSAGIYARNAARPYTLQGTSGPDRPPLYQTQRRELGAIVSYRF